MNYLKKNWTTIVLVFILIIGLCLLAYPSFSDYWNSFHQTRAIVNYVESIAELSNEEYETMYAEAAAYNQRLADEGIHWTLSEDEIDEYNRILNINHTGIMGYIEIEKIHCSLPIYHGTDEAVLQVAVGHLTGTSLPVGGSGSHCALSGHRGLPSARLFTDLDMLQEGDTFVVRVLDEISTYEVDQILIVDPDNLAPLNLEKGKDYCTLITCTPYGINTHRLLVRGKRVENAIDASNIRVTSDSTQIEPIIVAPAIAAPILLIILIMTLQDAHKRQQKRRKRNRQEQNSGNGKEQQ